MTESKITYVPTVVRWRENGEIQERTIHIQEGFNFEFEQSKKNYTAKAYKPNGQIPLLNLKKEDAYNLLGLSHADENGYETNNGKYVYVLDSEDLNEANRINNSNSANDLTYHMASWAGSGARVVDAKINNKGGLSIIHNGYNSSGNKEQYHISVFLNKNK